MDYPFVLLEVPRDGKATATAILDGYGLFDLFNSRFGVNTRRPFRAEDQLGEIVRDLAMYRVYRHETDFTDTARLKEDIDPALKHMAEREYLNHIRYLYPRKW